MLTITQVLKKITGLFAIISLFGLMPNLALAAETDQSGQLKLQIPIFGYVYAEDISHYIAEIYQTALYILVPLAIVVIIYAGTKWILSGGEPSKIQEAKKYIVSAFLGLTIALGSYLILSLYGLTNLNTPSVEYIEPMPIPVSDGEFEQPDTFKDTSSPGAPPVAGSMPRIFQGDYKRVNFNCPTKTVSSSGCGTVSVTMVLRYYGKNVSIEQAVAHMSKGGYIGCGVIGTSPSGFNSIAKANGLNYKTVSVDFNTIKNYVASGKPIIANVGDPDPPGAKCKAQRVSCRFTNCGHYIVLSGWDAPNNRFIINDPAGRTSDRFNGTWDDISKKCNFKGAYYVGN